MGQPNSTVRFSIPDNAVSADGKYYSDPALWGSHAVAHGVTDAESVPSVSATSGAVTATVSSVNDAESVPVGSASGSTAAVTYNVAFESSAGQDGGIIWESVFLMNDGRIMSFGTGNHAPEQSNAVRIIDPVTTPGTVQSYDLFPWTQNVVPPNLTTGVNRYVSNYDNHPSIYIPSEDKALWAGHGLFDVALATWTYGDRTPNTQPFDAWVDITSAPLIDQTYNPAVAWCSALDKGVWFGNSAGGGGQDRDDITLIERNTAGAPKPWKLRKVDLGAAGVIGIDRSRNSAVCVGKYFYSVARRASDETTPIFQKIDLETLTLAATLTAPSLDTNDYFPQLVYDSDRKRLVLIGVKLLDYDLDANSWTDITPAGWPGYSSPMGVYHPGLKAIFFRGMPFPIDGTIASKNFAWHKITFQQTVSRWTLVPIDTNASPFQGLPEEDYGGTKHVSMAWTPAKSRVYTFGGDFGSGADDFGQPNMGDTFVTNQPTSPQSYARDSSLNNDQYSINPYATGTVPWRLEHPYLPRNLSGTREERPARPDQCSLVWDPVRSKFWMMYHVLRTEFLYRNAGVPDPWANGSMSNSPEEPDATWSWVPGASGSPGTFTKESTSKLLVYRSGAGTSYSGGKLISDIGDERIGGWQYYAKSDRLVCLSSAQGSTRGIFIFNPATLDYEYRVVTTTGYTRMDCSMSQQAIVDNWVYAVALSTASGGTRKSKLIRVNLDTAIAASNGATLAGAAFEAFDLPWSLSPGSAWESAGTQDAKWWEHAGVVAIDRKIAVIKSYDGINEDGVTKLTIWDPDSRSFAAGQIAPEALWANSWCALPDTGEIFLGMNTSSGAYSNLRMWRYRVR